MNADPTDLSKQFIARGVPTHLWIANPDGRLEYCNSGWCDFAGRTSEDMLVEGWPGLIHPDDLREFVQDWRTARAARQVFEKECRLIAADGAARRFFIHAEPLLDGHGKVANWHGLNTALPEPGEAGSLDPENTAEAAAETIARVRSRMTASANHDLRQPLTALSFLADSLAKRLHDPISRDLLASMGRAIQSMRNVVEGQLYFDQVDSGRVEPSLVDHHVNASLIGLAAEFNTMAERKGLGFVLHPSSACIRTDPALLDTVLKNLVSNALRYTVEGRVVVGCRRQGDWLRIEIHDTGRGIAADELGLIWQDFFRSSRSVQEYPGGYGLGLSIVRRLADQLGHVVEVTTKPGRGSCFAVKVPLADRARLTAQGRQERRQRQAAGGDAGTAARQGPRHGQFDPAAGGGLGRFGPPDAVGGRCGGTAWTSRHAAACGPGRPAVRRSIGGNRHDAPVAGPDGAAGPGHHPGRGEYARART